MIGQSRKGNEMSFTYISVFSTDFKKKDVLNFSVSFFFHVSFLKTWDWMQKVLLIVSFFF